jgi:hypothetical protein
MRHQQKNPSLNPLPIKHFPKLVNTLTLIVALLMTVASLSGLLLPSTIYPTDDLRQTFMSNDVVNLLIGLPVLLGSMWLTTRGKLIGLLICPGALLYVLYNYTAYIFGMPFSLLTFVFLLLILLSAYVIVVLLKSIDKNAVQRQLAGKVQEKFASWVLILFGIAFFFRAISMLIELSTGHTSFPLSEIGTLIADMILSILWISGGVLLLRRKALGYVSGLGLLFSASTLYIGLILFLLLQPILTNAPFALIDVVVVLIMGMVCFIPTGLFASGVVSNRNL